MYARGKLKKEILEKQELELEQEAADLEGKLALKRVQLQQAQQNQLPIQSVQDSGGPIGIEAALAHQGGAPEAPVL